MLQLHPQINVNIITSQLALYQYKTGSQYGQGSVLLWCVGEKVIVQSAHGIKAWDSTF